ncbi:ER membrane protein complex subunit 1 isoform X2 [Macrosteles quadrilineatus]|uniref:ER membrane protein complex subunit 1 isoform X2 n=1 Tax=Macrosteles quadrilineatus TaxID=74068 RepID=UPI0023E1E3AD|nr:ER membrane protein complex subunit 1 isoform X2 [Macrosteles quadrilineatus]
MFSKVIFINLVLISLFCSAFCLYEDQIGKFDWKINQLGKLKFSNFESKPPSKKVFVATEENVIAALSTKTGEIVWRQILERDDNGKVQLLHVDGEMVTVTGSGPFTVRGWNANSGSLLYEWSITTASGPSIRWSIYRGKLYLVNIVDSQVEVSAYNLRTGGEPNSYTIPLTDFPKDQSKVALAGVNLVYISTQKANTVQAVHLTEQKNNIVSVTVPGPADSLSSVTSQADLFYVRVTSQGVGTSHLISIQKEAPNRLPSINLVKEGVDSHLRAVYQSSPEQSLIIKLQSIKGELAVSTHDDTGALVPELSSETVPLTADAPSHVEISCLSCLTRRDKTVSCHILVSGGDHSMHMLQLPGGALWSREEALASILSIELVDLPVSDGEAAIEKEFNITEGPLGMFTRRISSQLSQLQGLVMTVLGLKEQSSGNGRADLVRDDFGLHKIIVAVTSIGKVFGIDNLSHEIIWQFTIDDVVPFDNLGKEVVPLFLQRSARHSSGTHPALCTVLYKHKQTQEVVKHSFNPITGKPIFAATPEKLGYKLAQALLLPNVNQEFLKPLLLMDSAGVVHLYPALSQAAAGAVARSTYLYTADTNTGHLVGYSLHIDTADQGPVKKMKAVPLWEIRLAAQITAIAGKNPQEKVHSQGRVLGDRSVLYKYINPNLVAVLTQIEDPLFKNVLSVYLIDVVSGSVVFSVVHKRALEPIHVVHSENWVIYSYFSDKSRRTEVNAFDLYEGKIQSNTTAFSSVLNPIQPMVERQSYILPASIESMKETITEKGITSKHILMALNSGGVLELPWMLLDPRRPLASTPDLREEGVIPYMPELPTLPEAIINYNQTLLRVRGIHTSPSGLESTCLVFVYGLDMFYTRVAPSKTFDMLKEDFDYILITAVLVGLTVSAFMTKRLAARKALKQAWK